MSLRKDSNTTINLLNLKSKDWKKLIEWEPTAFSFPPKNNYYTYWNGYTSIWWAKVSWVTLPVLFWEVAHVKKNDITSSCSINYGLANQFKNTLIEEYFKK